MSSVSTASRARLRERKCGESDSVTICKLFIVSLSSLYIQFSMVPSTQPQDKELVSKP